MVTFTQSQIPLQLGTLLVCESWAENHVYFVLCSCSQLQVLGISVLVFSDPHASVATFLRIFVLIQ